MSEPDQASTIGKITDRLAVRFPTVARQSIERIVGEEYTALDSGRIRTYIPTLVENSARSRLQRETTEPVSPATDQRTRRADRFP